MSGECPETKEQGRARQLRQGWCPGGDFRSLRRNCVEVPWLGDRAGFDAGERLVVPSRVPGEQAAKAHNLPLRQEPRPTQA